MIDTKELRRLVQAAISKMNARDPEFASSVTPLAVLELLDRLEAAEKSDADSLTMYRKARDERDALRAEVIHIKEVEFPRKAQAVADGWRGKCERLEAKVAEMEQQAPIGTVHAMPGAGAFTMACFDAQDIPVGAKLYALPGAQGEEK